MGSSPPRRTRSPLIALAVIVGLGAAVSAAELLFSRPPAHTSSTPAHATPTPSPPAIFGSRTPPDNVQLVWVMRSWEQVEGSLRLHALQWNGHEVGSVELACGARCSVQQSPDGQRLLLLPQPGTARVVDASGHAIDSETVNATAYAWSDDSRTLCVLNDYGAANSSPGMAQHTLVMVWKPEQSTGPKTIADISAVPWNNGNWNVRACSTTADRVVLTLENDAVISALRVVQLSTGSVLYHFDDPPPTPGAVCAQCHLAPPLVVEQRGRAAIENLASGGVLDRDLSTGDISPAASVIESGPVIALSSSGAVAATPQRVVDLATGRWVWQAPSTVLGAISRPVNDDLLLLLSGPPSSGRRLYIVHADGTAVALADDFDLPQ